MRCHGCLEIIEDGLKECPLCGYDNSLKAIEIIHLDPETKLFDGRYILGRVIGCGGFGVTYIAWDTMLEKKVAIKEFLPSEFTTRVTGTPEITIFTGTKGEAFREGLSKFVEEANKLATFSNIDGIVNIYDCFEENQTAYIVMEYLEGETLETKLKREIKMEANEAVKLMLPIMKALVQVHNSGIIHRDIAPDNIFVLKDGKAKLLDFGSARSAQTIVEESRTVIIKKGYSPEEQYASRSTQEATTDVYAMAATLYKAITGEVPPDALERRMNMNSFKKDLLVDVSKYTNNISKNTCQAIQNAMQIDMKKRTPDMESFIRELSEKKIKSTKNNFKNGFVTFINSVSKKQKIIAASVAGIIICVAILMIVAPWKDNSDTVLTKSENGSGIDKDVSKKRKTDVAEAKIEDTNKPKATGSNSDNIEQNETTKNSLGDETLVGNNTTDMPSLDVTTINNTTVNNSSDNINNNNTSINTPIATANTASVVADTSNENNNSSITSQNTTQTTINTQQATVAPTQAYTEIKTASQLAAIKNNLSGNYKLMNNISITSTYGLGTSSSPFTGTFDGNGKTITITEGQIDNRKDISFSGSDNKGLFNYCTGTIKNLTMTGNMSYTATITKGAADAYIVIGPIAARVMSGGRIENCTSKVIVNIVATDSATSYTTHLLMGGICGYVEKGTVDGCTFYATTSNYLKGYSHIRSYTGGITGKGLNATVSNCKTMEYESVKAGYIISETIEKGATDRTSFMYIGGIAGYGSSLNILNCSAKCHITASPGTSGGTKMVIYAGGVLGYKTGTCDLSGSTYDIDASYVVVANVSNITINKGGITGN